MSTSESGREITFKLPRLRILLGVAAVICAAIAATAILVVSLHKSQHDPLPANIKQEASFPLYYPTKVPNGFHFDQAAYDSSTKVITYDYSTVNGNKIFFSLQPKPAHFNFDDFNNKQITGASQVTTPLGTATVGVLQKQTVSSIVTKDTWILIGAGTHVNLQQIEQVSQNLTPAK